MGLSIWDGSPRTLQFEIDDWRNTSWGFHAIDRSTTRCEVAISGNGSRMNKCHSRYFHHYLIPAGSSYLHTLYLRAANSAYTIDDENRTARGGECKCRWEIARLKSEDYNCSQAARMRLPGARYVGRARIGGAQVTEYQHIGRDGTLRRLALAPGLGCEVMEEVERRKGTLGILGAQRHYRVTTYIPGEPNRVSSICRLDTRSNSAGNDPVCQGSWI
jgi:hypothetical protein